MKLSIYSLKKILFSGEAVLLNCKTAMGEITVLNNHEPLIAVLEKGAMKVVDKNKVEHYFDVVKGFLEVSREKEVRCLVE